MFTRVAKHVTSSYEDNELAQYWALEYYTMMSKLDFLPNSPTLMNAGRPLGQLSACFVLPVEDDMIGICDAVKNQAIIHKSGGGTGFSFSRLRPSGAKVASTQGAASGPLSFMRVFNEMTETVKQGGMRRGANMGMLHVYHPDIMGFVKAKIKGDQFNNFNFSVAVVDDFMKAVEKNDRYSLHHDKTGAHSNNYVNAAELFHEIAYGAWLNGEPGVVFIDTINRAHTLPDIIEATNPCGEQPLLPNESCVLGSINLAKFVTSGKVDWERLSKVVQTAVRFLDDVIDVNVYPLPEIREMTLATRKIGLGVMGWADMLILLGMRYDSNEAVDLAREVSHFIQETALAASMYLATERGAFPRWADDERCQKGWKPLRNATVITIAPTGTLSIIANCNGGVQALLGTELERGHIDENNLWVHPLWEKRKELGLPDELFVKERDVHWSWLVKHQAAWQQNVCNAVSMTINMAPDCTVEDVKDAYMMAWKFGCKGLTVYRDGSRDGQILKDANLSAGGIELAAAKADKVWEGIKDAAEQVVKWGTNQFVPKPRPKRAYGFTDKVQVGCGKLFITFNRDQNGAALETFIETGKTGGCAAQSSAMGQLISVALRSGIKVTEIVKRLKGIKCPACVNKGLGVLSCPDAVARVLAEENAVKINLRNDGKVRVEKPDSGDIGGNSCPECGKVTVPSGGCVTCPECGWSKCS
jgi:ribonucleoside-diphosphate reductase alpha chain